MGHRVPLEGHGARSRRNVIMAGSALLAAGGLTLSGHLSARGRQAAASGLLLVQGFGTGNLFPTQGDGDVAPYTAILWDAAARGLFYTTNDGAAGLAPADALIAAIEAGERPLAALVAPDGDGANGQQVFALRLVYASLGSDPGAMTYQGEPIDEAEAAAWLGAAPEPLPKGSLNLAGGYLIIGGLPALDLPEGEGVRLTVGDG